MVITVWVVFVVAVGALTFFGARWTRPPSWEPLHEPRADDALRTGGHEPELPSELNRIIFGPGDGP